MDYERVHKAASGKTYRLAVNELSRIAGVEAKHTRSPRRDFEQISDLLGRQVAMMTELAVENARAQGKPFRNLFIRKGQRLYPIKYR